MVLVASGVLAEEAGQKQQPLFPQFRWVNELPKQRLKQLAEGTTHATFQSPSMGIDVGYWIYLPPGYDAEENKDRRYPVVYHLHGGRPGNEGVSAWISQFVDDAIRGDLLQPTIYVFPNGGPISWYNFPQREHGMGEDVFIQETIPHIDATYRTIAKREGRALQGFSQGGRGTTRIMFRHPELFGSVAPGGSGYATEKKIQENDGRESGRLQFGKGYNAWDLAAEYAKRENAPPLKPLIWVGTKGFNYENNLQYMKYLEELGIPFEKLIVPGVPHHTRKMYEKSGDKLMKFHVDNFRRMLSQDQ
ncbi:alpha/beta hydrolase [Calycomorphotria hydatis]|nr:alpha/beta hydrolase-fold protein [Calycomorphotria hydatis]